VVHKILYKQMSCFRVSGTTKFDSR